MLSSSFKSFTQLCGVLVIFLFVLLVTYFVTRWIAGHQKVRMTGRNLNVIETLRIANNKCIQLVKAGTEYLVIAVGKDEVTLLAQLTEDQLLELSKDQQEGLNKGKTEAPVSMESFQDILDRIKEHIPKKKD